MHHRVRRFVDELRDRAVVLVDETARLDRYVGPTGQPAGRGFQQGPGEQGGVIARGGVDPAEGPLAAVVRQAPPEGPVQPGKKFDDEARFVLIERMQRIGEFAPLDREVFQHQYESAGEWVESGPVCLWHVGEFRRQLL